MDRIRVGVIGCGHWGPNHIRNLSSLKSDGVDITVAADRVEERRKRISELYPWVRVIEEGDAVIEDPDVDAVVIASPVHTHYPLAYKAPKAGKHVLVEKPFVTEIEQAETLVLRRRARAFRARRSDFGRRSATRTASSISFGRPSFFATAGHCVIH